MNIITSSIVIVTGLALSSFAFSQASKAQDKLQEINHMHSAAYITEKMEVYRANLDSKNIPQVDYNNIELDPSFITMDELNNRQPVLKSR